MSASPLLYLQVFVKIHQTLEIMNSPIETLSEHFSAAKVLAFKD